MIIAKIVYFALYRAFQRGCTNFWEIITDDFIYENSVLNVCLVNKLQFYRYRNKLIHSIKISVSM